MASNKRSSAADIDLYKVLLVSRSLRIRMNSINWLNVLQAANSYTYEEIQIGLANCADGGDPVAWLNDNWQKLIETVQTLSTKYGQEHKENIVGTISTREAREALKKHKGNVWQAVTECIEQRRLAFNAIKAQGNYSRDDIVTCLTQHQGNVDLAMNELNRLQLKPFLLKIFGSPSGADNQSAAASIETKSQVDDGSSNGTGTISRTDEDKNDILRDIETIIGNMEEKQSKQTETILQTIESLVGNMMMVNTSTLNSQPMSSSASSFSGASYDRIDVKSPVQLPKQQLQQSNGIGDSNAVDVENEVRQFVTSHIQDIVPDIAALVNKELNESEAAATAMASTNGAFNYEDDDDDDTAEYEDAIIELVLENPPESETPADPLTATMTSAIIESENIEEPIQLAIIEPENPVESTQAMFVEPETPGEPIQPTFVEPETLEEPIQSMFVEAEAPSELTQNIETVSAVAISREEPVDTPRDIEEPNAEEINERPEPEPAAVKRTPSVKRPKFAVNKVFQRSSFRQSDRRRIRELERQLKMQQHQRESDSRMSGYLSDSTVVPDDNGMNATEGSQMAEIVDAEVRTFSFSITEQEHVENEKIDQTQNAHSSLEHIDSIAVSSEMERESIVNGVSEEGPSGELTTKDAKNRNLSEIVQDTKELIQKMKNEIDEDIAMSVSEFDGSDSGSYENESEYSEEFDDGEQDSIEFDENDLDDSDGWTDVDDDEGDGDLPNENDEDDGGSEAENLENTVLSLRSSQSIESERFVEAQEEMTVSPVQSEVASDHNVLEEEIIEAESARTDEEPIASTATEVAAHVAIDEQEGEVEIVDSIEIPPDEEVVNDNLENDVDEAEEEAEEETNEQDLPAIDSVEYLENIIEIQQSLQSSLISLNVREAPAIEAESTEPSEESSMPVEVDSAVAVEETIEAIPSENTNEVIDAAADVSEHSEAPHSLTKSSSQMSSEAEETNADSLPEDTSEEHISDAQETVSGEQTTMSKPSSNESLVETFKYNKITVPVLTQCSQSNINVMQLKKGEASRNKIPVRRPSFSEPSASIRNLQNELFGKQSKSLVKPVAKKPSKIVPPKLFFKEAPSTSKKMNDTNHIAMAVASTSSKAIPKKKYYETCFSDDYQTSDDEKPIGSSKRVIPNLVKIVETRAEDTVIDPDALARRFMDDGLLDNYLDAALAVELMQMKFDEKTALAAAVECNSLEQAIAFLRQECELCMETYPMNKIVSMLKCTHSCCEDCAKNYFTIQVSGAGSCTVFRDLNFSIHFVFLLLAPRLPIAVLPTVRVHFVNCPIWIRTT